MEAPLKNDDDRVDIAVDLRQLMTCMGALSALLGVPFEKTAKPREAEENTEVVEAIHDRCLEAKQAIQKESGLTEMLSLSKQECAILRQALASCLLEFGDSDTDIQTHLNASSAQYVESVLSHIEKDD